MENMNNIFNINKNIDRVKVLINEGKLLQAHLVSNFSNYIISIINKSAHNYLQTIYEHRD